MLEIYPLTVHTRTDDTRRNRRGRQLELYVETGIEHLHKHQVSCHRNPPLTYFGSIVVFSPAMSALVDTGDSGATPSNRSDRYGQEIFIGDSTRTPARRDRRVDSCLPRSRSTDC